MSDVSPTSFHRPALVRASAYTSEQAARLGVPRGLVPYDPRTALPPKAAHADAISAPQAAVELPDLSALAAVEPTIVAPNLGLGPRTRYRFQAHEATSPASPPSNLTSNPFSTRRAGAVRKLPSVSARARWLSLGTVAIAAAAAGFFLARPIPLEEEAGDTARRLSGTRAWSPADRVQLEAALAAGSNGPLDATTLLARLHAIRPHLAGLPVFQARAAAARSSFAEADVHLTRAAEEPHADRAEIAFARATNFAAAQRKFEDMRNSLNDAISLDPTRAEFYFHRAEVDRRQGRTQEALEGYDRALLLARSGLRPSRETIAFRRRLLLIEHGREGEIDAKAYQAAFAQPSPPADWILTAAAVALQHRDPDTGARWLRAARAVMPRWEYLERIDDFFFRNHLDDVGLKELFPTKAERTRFHASAPALLLDP